MMAGGGGGILFGREYPAELRAYFWLIQRIIWGARDQTQLSNVQGKYLTFYTLQP